MREPKAARNAAIILDHDAAFGNRGRAVG